MKSKLRILLLSIACLSSFISFGQKDILKIEIENLSIKAPSDWLVRKIEKKLYGFTIIIYNDQNENQVSVNCIKKAMDPESAIVNSASEKSLKPKMDYMIIEKVKNDKLNKYNGKFLEYTNTYLMDNFRGGFYGIENNGYTYIIEYYSADTPQAREEVRKIINSLIIHKPDFRPNFFEVEKEYLNNNVKSDEELDNSTTIQEGKKDKERIDKTK